MSDPKNPINWMYEGAQSHVNREDYLTGRKIDRNFELYNSDFKQEKSVIDNLSNKSRAGGGDKKESKTSLLLDLETIKKEDPLVAIKVKEEQVRREILENPLKLKRLHSIVMNAMEKKFKKMVRKKSPSPSPPPKKRKFSPHRRRRSSSSSSSEKSKEKGRKKEKNRSEKLPTKKRHDSSSSCDNSGGKSSKNYGLIYLKDSSKKPSTSSGKNSSKIVVRTSPPVEKRWNEKQSSKRKLTDEEMEEKRREMMQNAKWRDEVRRKNQESYVKREKEEEKRNDDRSQPVDFIRPMMSRVVDESSVEQRIKSKKHSIQRRSTAMDSNFARK